jgi:2',3'-cyclic-nucleotide 2'-phosphodiesterase (5'-nucleotidase family)
MNRKRATTFAALALALVMVLAAGMAQAAPPASGEVHFWLTVLHNNDGESQVIDAGGGLEDFGGAARFKTLVDDLKWEAVHGPRFTGEQGSQSGAKRGVLMLSSGDNFLAGPEFTASLVNGVPFYDTIAMELIGYDAVSFGNHDFDFGPDVLADFLAGYTNPPPYLGANLDFSAEPVLQAYVDAGVISAATIIKERGELIGVIGLETPNLPFISSPRNVEVSDDLVNIVQEQVDMLEASGVNKIILAGHLQNITNDIELAAQIDGVDVIVAGGGDELLANLGDLLIPGDEGAVYGAYPQFAVDVDGTQVPVVTTSGEYRYVGKLVVGFDKDGNVVELGENSGPVRVATGDCNGSLPCDDAVEPDPTVQSLVVDPVVAYLEGLANNIVATSEVALDGRRDSVRFMETNQGNLMADSQRWQAEQLAPIFGVPEPDVALQNGGGIRNNTIIPAGNITELDTFDMAPFPNFVSIVPDIPREQFKEILENAVACTQPDDFVLNPNCGSGRFAQISGFSFEWSASGTGMIIDVDGNVIVPGTRVQEVTLDDGTVIVTVGVVQPGDPVTIATADFLANGGDQYPFRGAPFTTVGVTYQQALVNYLVQGLGGLITAADYPEGGEGRIIELP